MGKKRRQAMDQSSTQAWDNRAARP